MANIEGPACDLDAQAVLVPEPGSGWWAHVLLAARWTAWMLGGAG